MISTNKNKEFMKLVTCDSNGDVHSSYKKKVRHFDFHTKKIFLHGNSIWIKIG